MTDFNIEHERKVLLEHGYREFPVHDEHKRASYAFERKFRDDKGILYPIFVWLYAPVTTITGTVHYGGYTVELPVNEPFMTFEQHEFLHATPNTIKQWEDRCRLFWQVMGCKYYETYDYDYSTTD